MPYESSITRDALVYAGTDKRLQWTIYTDSTLATIRDVTGYAITWVLSSRKGGSALLTKTTAGGGGVSITGTFNTSPSVNTQRVEVSISDTDTDAYTSGTRWYELKRTDDGFEDVIAVGAFYIHDSALAP